MTVPIHQTGFYKVTAIFGNLAGKLVGIPVIVPTKLSVIGALVAASEVGAGSDHVPSVVMSEDGSAFRGLNDPDGVWKSTESQLPVSTDRQLQLESEWSRLMNNLRASLPPDLQINDPRIPDRLDQCFRSATSWAPPRDPLTLDIDGDGIEAVGINASKPVYFDHNADGIKTATGWIKADDGLLVLDLNSNCQIDSGRELFGDNTLLPNGEAAAHGYEALAQHDSNADGKIDSTDPIYAQLRIWQDTNQDGISQAEELKTLLEAGIASISVQGTATQINLGNGNSQPWSGSFTRIDGTTGDSGSPELSGSLLLASNNFYREFADDPELTDAAQALPQLGGSGWVRDLREAMSLGTPEAGVLQDAVAVFSAATTAYEQRALLEDVISAWAGTTGRLVDGEGEYALVTEGGIRTTGSLSSEVTTDVIRLMPTGMFVNVSSGQGRSQQILTQQGQELLDRVALLEVFNGTRFVQVALPGQQGGNFQLGAGTSVGEGAAAHKVYTLTLGGGQVELLQEAWESLAEGIYSQLALQTRLKPYLDCIELAIYGDEVQFESAELVQMLEDAKALNPSHALGDLVDLVRFVPSLLKEVGFNSEMALAQWITEWPSGSPLWDNLTALGLERTSEGNSRGSAGRDIFVGGDGTNTYSGREGNDFIFGGLGNDVLDGGEGHDFLYGGRDNDTLSGSAGNDTYVFNLGDGADRITDYDSTSGNLDTLRLGVGLTAANTEVIRSGSDLVLRWTGNVSDSVTIKNVFSGSQVQTGGLIESIVFDDSTVWGIADLGARLVQDGSMGNDTLQGLNAYANRLGGLEGNDTLHGGAQGDVLEGASGDDSLDGGIGNDTYLFNLGDGADRITDYDGTVGNHDTLRLGAGLTQTATQVIRSGSDLVLRWTGNASNSVTIKNVFSGSQVQTGSLIESIVFDDVTVWGITDVVARLVQDGSMGNDTLHGLNAYANRLKGLEGNDTLHGGAQGDVLEGGSGDDILNGNAGDDRLTGGLGSDILDGGTGSDTYIFNLGDGADRITDYDGTVGNHDTLRLGAGLMQAATQVIRSDRDLVLRWTGNASDSVTIKNVFYGSQVQTSSLIESIVFDDGAVWTLNNLVARSVQDNTMGNDLLHGGAQGDVLDGGAGDDSLYGNEGADTLIGGTGRDVLNGGTGNDTYHFNLGEGADTVVDFDTSASNHDTIRLGAGLVVSDTEVVRNGSDLMLRWTSNHNDSVTIMDVFYHAQVQSANLIESVVFADGTTWSMSDLMERSVHSGSAAQDTLHGVNAYINHIKGLEGDDWLHGGAQGDALEGGAGDDTLNGNAGADTLIGGTGRDVLNGDTESDIYHFNLGDGADTVIDFDTRTGNHDTIRLGAGLLAIDTEVVRDGSDLMLRWTGNHADSVTIKDLFYSDMSYNWHVQSASVIESVVFADGTTWSMSDLMGQLVQEDLADGSVLRGINGYSNHLRGLEGNDSLHGGDQGDLLEGGSGNDSLYGRAGADTFIGGAGDDALTGGMENDTYHFNLGDGADVLVDYGGHDTIRLGAGLLMVDTEVIRDGDSLLLRWTDNHSDSVTIHNPFSQSQVRVNHVVESVTFADGSSWTWTDMVDRLVQDG